MGLLEERIRLITYLRINGHDETQIARALNISVDEVGQYDSATRRAIKSQTLQGKTFDEIADELEISKDVLNEFAKYSGLRSFLARYSSSNSSGKVLDAITNGVRTRREIAEISGLGKEYVRSIVIKIGIPIPKEQVVSPNLKMNHAVADELIAQGLTLEEIGARAGDVTRERMRQYINKSGQYNKWVAAKEKVAEKKAAHENLENAIESQGRNISTVILQGAYKNASWEEQRAWDYVSSRKSTGDNDYDLSMLVEFFRKYKNSPEMNLKQLGKPFGLFPGCVSSILEKSGLRKMSKNATHGVAKDRKKRIREAQKAGFSASDMEYFLRGEIKKRNIVATYSSSPSRKRREIGHVGYERLTYRDASQIYEARDLGFSVEETAELVGVSPEMVRYASTRERRKKISSTIKEGLQALHLDKRITKPYL